MRFIKRFIQLESSVGLLLSLFVVLAILMVNSPWSMWYEKLISFHLTIGFGVFELEKTLVHWVNDLLMSFFFLLIGLELKREGLEGQFVHKANRTLPFIAALGGIVCPALIYAFFNWDNATALKGWAIPAATDIAFALGVLALLGSRVNHGLKLALLSLAIFDDLVAILAIAVFYTDHIYGGFLMGAFFILLLLAFLNRCSVKRLSVYLILGSFLWLCVLKSGIHPTIAGVLLAFCIPLKTSNSEYSPLRQLEHTLHPWVSFIILPIFAFFNAGVSLAGFSGALVLNPITLGIMIGLFIGKQLGVMLFSFIGVKLKWCALPLGVNWRQYYGVAVVSGIGFTMSLFIGMLAFSSPEQHVAVRLGVMIGSLLSGLLGYLLLYRASLR